MMTLLFKYCTCFLSAKNQASPNNHQFQHGLFWILLFAQCGNLGDFLPPLILREINLRRLRQFLFLKEALKLSK